MSSKISQLYKELCNEWKKSAPKDFEKMKRLIEQLKEEFLMANTAFMPVKSEEKNQQENIVIQRDVLETSALLAVEMKDIPALERAIAEVKHYYNEIAGMRKEFDESPQKYMMLGLNLMNLLAQNKLADFHMELELLPKQLLTQNIYISHPVKLEQYLMEGTYNKIFLSKANVPAPAYVFFMDALLDTVRNAIGECVEKAYDSLTMPEAARMLFYEKGDESPVLEYAKRRKWKTADGGKRFVFVDPAKKKTG